MIQTQGINEALRSIGEKRMKEIQTFWQTPIQERKIFLLATHLLLDGHLKKAEAAYQLLPKNFPSMYNLMCYYKEKFPLKYDQTRNEIQRLFPNELKEKEKEEKIKRVALFLPHLQKTGGMKMLIKMYEMFKERGYDVSLFIPYTETNITTSVTLFDKEYTVHTYQHDDELKDISKTHPIAIAPHWDYIYPLWKNFRHVFYYSQGDYDIFSDHPRSYQLLKLFFSLPIEMMSVSSFLSEWTEKKYGRKSSVHPCDIDLNRFHPGEKKERPTVVVMGQASVTQKQINETIEALMEIKSHRDFDIMWMTPNEHESVPYPEVIKITNPTQEELAMHLRQATIFVSGSLIEAFSLPPLEAMASGTAVVTADNGGNREYVRHGENCLVFQSKDWQTMKKQVEYMLEHEKERQKMIQNGLVESKRFQATTLQEKMMERIEESVGENYIIHSPF
jgi:glycosyltransferase involved in cell wall biosynthesis